MRDLTPIERFERRLRELGCPVEQARSQASEMADHYEDLSTEAREAGLSNAEISVRARQRLGDPDRLAEESMAAFRQSFWCSRHPFLTFCLLPFIALVALSPLAPMLVLELLPLCFADEKWKAIADGHSGFVWLQIVMAAAYYGISLGVVLFVSRLARRSAAGWKWALAGASLGSLQAGFGLFQVVPHSLIFGYSPYPHLGLAAIPLLIVAGVFYWQWRQPDWSSSSMTSATPEKTVRLPLLTAALLVLFVTGCATQNRPDKPVHQRGWIGGQYQRPKAASIPHKLEPDRPTGPSLSGQGGAIRVVALNPDTPASRAGLQAGDWITEVNGRPTTRLDAFHQTIHDATPGTSLPVKVIRDGATVECDVRVGREQFRRDGNLTVALPSVVHRWDLLPNPGFSFVLLGFQPNWPPQEDLGVAREKYHEHWKAWLGIFQVGKGETIVSQQVQ